MDTVEPFQPFAEYILGTSNEGATWEIFLSADHDMAHVATLCCAQNLAEEIVEALNCNLACAWCCAPESDKTKWN